MREIGLADHAHCLNESGVHGGVIALDNDLDHDKLSLALQIPLSSFEVREGEGVWAKLFITIFSGKKTGEG